MRISHDTAHHDLIKVFDKYVDSQNEDNRFWEVVPTKVCSDHYEYKQYINRKGERKQRRIDTCWQGKKCHGRFEKKYTREFEELWTTRKVLFRLLDRYYEDMVEERRLGREPRRLDF